MLKSYRNCCGQQRLTPVVISDAVLAATSCSMSPNAVMANVVDT